MMIFEKLSENKIKITLTTQDLIEKEIDLHTFMSNALERQDLFLNMLEEADEEIGFDVKDCNIRVETLAMADGKFILTVTKILPDVERERFSHKKVITRRKKTQTNFKQAIYNFETFEDFCNFVQYLREKKLDDSYKIAKSILLYSYKQSYYLVLNDIDVDYKKIVKFNLSIIEFSKFVNSSEVFISKILECGTQIVKNNALKIGMEHFLNY